MKILTREDVRKLLDNYTETLNNEGFNTNALTEYSKGNCTFTEYLYQDAIATYKGEISEEFKVKIKDTIVSEVRKNQWSDTLGENGYWIDTRYTFDNGWETMVFRKRNGKVDYKHAIDEKRYAEPEDALEGHSTIYKKWKERIS